MSTDSEQSIHDIFKKIKEQQEKYIEFKEEIQKNKDGLSCLDERVNKLTEEKNSRDKELHTQFSARAKYDSKVQPFKENNGDNYHITGLRTQNEKVSLAEAEYIKSQLAVGAEMQSSMESQYKKSEQASLLDQAKERYNVQKAEEQEQHRSMRSPWSESATKDQQRKAVVVEYKKKKAIKGGHCDQTCTTLHAVTGDDLSNVVTQCTGMIDKACLEHWGDAEDATKRSLEVYIRDLKEKRTRLHTDMDVAERRAGDTTRRQTKEKELQEERISSWNVMITK